MLVRPEAPADAAAIAAVNAAAFERAGEADLVDALRTAGALTLSLVAEVDQRIVGHVAFSPVALPGAEAGASGVGLGPLAVLETHRRRGIGAALCAAGLEACAAAGWPLAVVLGEPRYYGRFGFVPAARYGLWFAPDIPADAFQVKLLGGTPPAIAPGPVRYHRAFDAV